MTVENTLDHGLKTSVLDSANKVEQDQNWAALDPNRVATGTFANRPAAGTANRFYYATDTQALYWDNGATWAVAGQAVLEGTWTPVIADASSGGNESPTAASSPTYTKIGRQCTVRARFANIDTTGLTAGNILYVTGLPFPSAAGPINTGVVTTSSITFGGYVTARLAGGVSYFSFIDCVSATPLASMLVSAFTDDNADVEFTITYDV